ncbi:MAG: PEGA domain-containing protein [Candidatus Pacebacteria bacterium]|nr:PEGA domain-containing protein [Candidatus Paceibacterota bacterium]
MKRGLLLAGIGLMVLGGGGYLIFSQVLNRPSKGALQISSTPESEVFLNGEKSGITPYFNDKLEVKEYAVKLVPTENAGFLAEMASESENWPVWESNISLAANVITSVNYQLAPEEELFSGEILALEKISDSKTSALAVVSLPDGALVKINNDSKGFSPISVDGLSPGNYQITISSPGFAEKTISAQTIVGYKLTVSVQLAQEKLAGVAEASGSGNIEGAETEREEEATEEEPAPVDPERPYVKIKQTPTGWLRVRMEPTTTAAEVAKVDPGQVFAYLEETKEGWYKIEYEAEKEGWVSGVYAELVE